MAYQTLAGESGTDRKTGGTPEETGLKVRLLGEEWIVENGTGESVGSSGNRRDAIALAMRASRRGKTPSVISILGKDGAVERSIQPTD